MYEPERRGVHSLALGLARHALSQDSSSCAEALLGVVPRLDLRLRHRVQQHAIRARVVVLRPLGPVVPVSGLRRRSLALVGPLEGWWVASKGLGPLPRKRGSALAHGCGRSGNGALPLPRAAVISTGLRVPLLLAEARLLRVVLVRVGEVAPRLEAEPGLGARSGSATRLGIGP